MKVWVSAAEREEIEARAASACLSISAYLRAAALSHSIRRIYDLGAVEQLAVVGRDLTRLCQLLGRAVAEGGQVREGRGGEAVGELLAEARVVQQKLLKLMSRA
jgi:hypothetical protein